MRTLLALILLAALFIPNSEVLTSGKQTDKQVKSEIDYLESKYENFYISLFSIPDTRSFSIIQNESTINLYENHWISPKKYSSLLDETEREILKSQIISYLSSLDESQSDKMLSTIKSWCMIESQFHLINNSMEIYDTDLLKAIYRQDNTNHIFNQFNDRGKLEINQLDEMQKDKVYFESINQVATLSFDKQLTYYADVFNELSLVFVKK